MTAQVVRHRRLPRPRIFIRGIGFPVLTRRKAGQLRLQRKRRSQTPGRVSNRRHVTARTTGKFSGIAVGRKVSAFAKWAIWQNVARLIHYIGVGPVRRQARKAKGSQFWSAVHAGLGWFITWAHTLWQRAGRVLDFGRACGNGPL